jgi:anti-sigma B factor antagonist
MDLSFRDDSGITIIKVVGELDETCSSGFTQLFDRLIDEGRRTFVINLEGVNFIDSSGLATLVRCFKQVRNAAGNICLAALQPPVHRVLELTRLDRAFEIRPDIPQAVRFFTD